MAYVPKKKNHCPPHGIHHTPTIKATRVNLKESLLGWGGLSLASGEYTYKPGANYLKMLTYITVMTGLGFVNGIFNRSRKMLAYKLVLKENKRYHKFFLPSLVVRGFECKASCMLKLNKASLHLSYSPIPLLFWFGFWSQGLINLGWP